MAISCSNIDTLPEDCVSKILTYTSPLDACNFSMVSSTLHSAANSDTLWRSFLPSDYEDIISRTLNPLTLQSSSSYKHLFFSLCQQPLLLDRGHIVSRIHLWYNFNYSNSWFDRIMVSHHNFAQSICSSCKITVVHHNFCGGSNFQQLIVFSM